MKAVGIISAIAEWKAVKEIYPDLEINQSPYGETLCMRLDTRHLTPGTPYMPLYHSGWGKIASAGMMQYVIDHERPDLIVNLGTCGGFEGDIDQDDIVLVDSTIVYDIVELMGDPNVTPYYASSLDLSWLPEPYPHPVRKGLIASADSDLQPDKIPILKSEGAIAADWESAALAWVARRNGARLLILRGVSDLVNEKEGEAYDNLPLFEERTKVIMRKLFDQLPDWLNAVSL